MGTAFAGIRSYIRAAVRDYDPSCYMYSDAALNGQIRLTILGEDSYEESADETFNVDLTKQQKLILSLKTAIRILNGTPRSFAYKSPVMSVSRSGWVNELIANLETALADAEGGIFAIATDTDFDALIQGFDRYVNGVDRAYSAWPGLPAE